MKRLYAEEPSSSDIDLYYKSMSLSFTFRIPGGFTAECDDSMAIDESLKSGLDLEIPRPGMFSKLQKESTGSGLKKILCPLIWQNSQALCQLYICGG